MNILTPMLHVPNNKEHGEDIGKYSEGMFFERKFIKRKQCTSFGNIHASCTNKILSKRPEVKWADGDHISPMHEQKKLVSTINYSHAYDRSVTDFHSSNSTDGSSETHSS